MSVDLVIPGADEFGARITRVTPLGKIVAVLRRHNPTAPYVEIKLAAMKVIADAVAARAAQAVGPQTPESAAPAPAAAPARPRRRPKTEAEESLVPVAGGEPIPAEPPANR